MKKLLIPSLLCLAMSLGTVSCKKKEVPPPPPPTVETPATETTTAAPVEIAPDEALSSGVTDATKDFPGVTATVANGEITLTGSIARDRLPALMQSLSALNPKKINNQLTINK